MNVILIALSRINSIEENNINTDLMREFISRGHDVTIYCGVKGDDKSLFSKTHDTKADIYNVNVGRVQKVNAIVKGINFLTLDSKFKKAIKKTYKKRPDLVLYLTPPITLTKTISFLKKKYSCKSYLLLKDIFPQNSIDLNMLSKTGIKGFIYRYFKRIEKKLYLLSDNIGCMSPANVDYLIKNNPYIDKNIVEVNPNSIDVTRLNIENDISKEDVKRRFGIPSNKKVFIYGGNLGKPQDIPFVLKCIKACEEINNVYFVIVGDGTDYHLVEKYVNGNNPKNLLVINRLPNEEYRKLVLSCDVALIFLDHRFTIPNFPSRLLDYMRVGLPIYACTDANTDIGKTIVDGGFGRWSPSDNVDKFVSTIKDIVNTDIKDVRDIEHKYLIEHFSSKNAYETIIKHFK